MNFLLLFLLVIMASAMAAAVASTTSPEDKVLRGRSSSNNSKEPDNNHNHKSRRVEEGRYFADGTVVRFEEALYNLGQLKAYEPSPADYDPSIEGPVGDRLRPPGPIIPVGDRLTPPGPIIPVGDRLTPPGPIIPKSTVPLQLPDSDNTVWFLQPTGDANHEFILQDRHVDGDDCANCYYIVHRASNERLVVMDSSVRTSVRLLSAEDYTVGDYYDGWVFEPSSQMPGLYILRVHWLPYCIFPLFGQAAIGGSFTCVYFNIRVVEA